MSALAGGDRKKWDWCAGEEVAEEKEQTKVMAGGCMTPRLASRSHQEPVKMLEKRR